jgi:uncharacterized protein YgiM (DUF1202 family)
MNRPTRCFQLCTSLIAGAIALAVSSAVHAQASEDISFTGVIKGTDVYVRCGAAESYYPFTRVNAGDLVKVTGEKFDWYRIGTLGPAFKHATGFIKYAKGDAGRFRLAADGKSGVTLGKTEVIAPNLDSNNNPKDSWKSIARLEADQALRVLQTTETEQDVIHKIALPQAAHGWVSKAYIDRATDAQAEQFKLVLEGKVADRKPSKGDALSSAADESADVQPVKRPSNDRRWDDGFDESFTPGHDDGDQGHAALARDPVDPDLGALAPVAPGEPAAATQPTQIELPTFDDLEAAFKLLQKEPIESAEVGPLRELYLGFMARTTDDTRKAVHAKRRADQLQIWADIQKKRAELDAVRAKVKLSAQETEAVRQALESSAEYDAVGRIAASTIYDGERLPKLLRLQDAATGRAIAYLKPDVKYELVNLIGNLVGIVGEKTYDETLRLNVIETRRIDILTPGDTRTTQFPPEVFPK